MRVSGRNIFNFTVAIAASGLVGCASHPDWSPEEAQTRHVALLECIKREASKITQIPLSNVTVAEGENNYVIISGNGSFLGKMHSTLGGSHFDGQSFFGSDQARNDMIWRANGCYTQTHEAANVSDVSRITQIPQAATRHDGPGPR
jgi:hypothetical protein